MGRTLCCVYFVVSVLGLVLATGASDQQKYQSTGYKSTEYKGADYASTTGEKDEDSQVYVYPAGFKGGRYYYGGIYRGACHNDGMYYRDEDSFVICSNGNAYVQPCAPGTRSSGQHRYSPGYYYGYSDFCDINLVDQGYGPAHYAPYGVPTYNAPGYSGQDTAYNSNKATDYGVNVYSKDSYGKEDYATYSADKADYAPAKDSYTDKNSYATGDAYSKNNYAKTNSYTQQQTYSARDIYDKKETSYEPSAKF